MKSFGLCATPTGCCHSLLRMRHADLSPLRRARRDGRFASNQRSIRLHISSADCFFVSSGGCSANRKRVRPSSGGGTDIGSKTALISCSLEILLNFDENEDGADRPEADPLRSKC